MKRIIKIFIYIFLICITIKVDAKELIYKELELENNESLHNYGAAYSPIDGDVVYGGMSTNRSSAIYGGYDMVFIKFDKNGKKVFDKAFGGDGMEYLSSIKSTSDNGYIAVGLTQTSSITEGPYTDAIIVKLDKNGNIIWNSNFYVSNNYNKFNDVVELKNGNYIAVGSSNETYNNHRKHAYIVKYDKDGNELWRKEHTGHGYDEFNNIIQLENENIVVTGISEYNIVEHKSYKYKIIYDTDGNIINEEIGNIENDTYKKTFSTNDGGYIITEIEKITDDYQYATWYSKYDKNNNLVWRNKFRERGYDTSELTFVEMDEYYLVLGRNIILDNNNQFVELNSTLLYVSKENGHIIDTYNIKNDFGTILNYHLNDNNTLRCYSFKTETDSEGYPLIFDLYFSYDIVTKNNLNGTFTVDKVKAKNKEIVTINAKPKLGYVVDKIILTDSKGNKTELHELTFEMIPDDVEIEVLFKELINPQTGFSIISIMSILGFLIFITIKSKKKTLTN